MNANIESNIRGAFTGRRGYTIAMVALMLLGSNTTASVAKETQPLETDIRLAQTLRLSQTLLAEANPAPVAATSSSDSDSTDSDNQSKKQKKKLEKQAEKDAEEAAKANKEKAKAAEKAAKKDDTVADKSKNSDKDAKAKKDDKENDKGKSGKAADAGKSKTVIIEQSPNSDKAGSTSHKVVTETTSTGTVKNKTSDEEDKKETDETKTADTELKQEAAPVYTPDSALISVLKDLSRSLKESEEFTKIEDPSQKAIVEVAQQALHKALENPQLAANRIVEKVGKENLMPPMGTEAWSSGELDLGGKNKASLSVVWAKRENGLLNLTIAGVCPDKKAPNGKKIGEFIVLLNARSSVENGFDIQSQQNVSFWLGKIASIAVESDCCAPPAPAAAGEGDADKKPKEVSTEADDVKKKSLTVLPVLLTSRRREYLSALMAVEKHNSLVAEKLQEINLANQRKESDKAADTNTASSSGDLPAGVEGKAMQEAYERALRSVAMQELAKMKASADSPPATKGENDKKSSDTTSGDKTTSKESTKSAVVESGTVIVAGAGIASGAGNASGKGSAGGAGSAAGAGSNGGAATTATGVTGANGTPGTNVSTGASGSGVATNTQLTEKSNGADKAPSSAPATPGGGSQTSTQSQTAVSSSASQPPILQSAAGGQGSQSSQGSNTPPTVAMLPNSTNSVGFTAANDMSAFRSVRQPSVGALLMVPERALAGQSVTITIYDAKRNPESAVELSLNGTTMLTNLDGQVSFTIPEDATPGRSLNVELSARPELSPSVIDILQPLIVPSEKQNPSIEKVSLTGQSNDTLIVDGHFFDGIAANNKIMIDGQPQGRVAAASPVQLRVSLPVNLQGGDHIILISCDGLNSNPSIFLTQSAPIPVPPQPDKKRPKQTTTRYRY